jgi:hypothetical protein
MQNGRIIGVRASPVAVWGCLCRGQQGLIEQRLAVDVACRSMLGLHASDGAVLIVVLSGALHIGNGCGGSDNANGPK